MTINPGELLPESEFFVMGQNGPEVNSTASIFEGRRVALFGLPGAYTPICHVEHLPGIVSLCETLKQNGIDTVACTAVNDVFVLDRWANELGAQGNVLMLADGNADFALRTGLAIDLSMYGLGFRSNRYAMLVANGRVRSLDVEDIFSHHKKSSAASFCKTVEQAAVA
jgi:glutaredoxin/glutathione-dependent peroxiredoxin